MKYEVEDFINFPHAEVFDTFVNQLPKMAEFIPDIKEIRVLESREEGDKAYRVSQWVGKRELPGWLKKFTDVDELGWIDRAVWDLKKFYVDYTLELPSLGKYVGVSGRNEILPSGKGAKAYERLAREILEKHGL